MIPRTDAFGGSIWNSMDVPRQDGCGGSGTRVSRKVSSATSRRTATSRVTSMSTRMAWLGIIRACSRASGRG